MSERGDGTEAEQIKAEVPYLLRNALKLRQNPKLTGASESENEHSDSH
jgi:hypothetical protein